MRVLVGVAVLLISLCTEAAAQPRQDVWRMHTENLAADRARVHACLEAGDRDCSRVIQNLCGAVVRPGDHDNEPEDPSPAEMRICDWRAIAAWEDEMNALLAALRGRLLSGSDELRNIDASQHAWEKSMLADVGLGMDHYTGGSLAGPVGAHIRARATAWRAIYLNDMNNMLDDGG